MLRRWVKELTADPAQAFPSQGQLKVYELGVERLRRVLTKLKAERDIIKKGRDLLWLMRESALRASPRRRGQKDDGQRLANVIAHQRAVSEADD